jgi:hypothetical protein
MAVVAGALVLGLVTGAVGLAAAAEEGDDATTDAEQQARPMHAPGDGEHPMLELFVELTGLSEDEIREAKEEGKSFAKIAEEAGVSTETLVDEIYGERLSTVKDRLADGLITEGQAEWMEDNMRERIEERLMTEGTGARGPGPRGRMRPMGAPDDPGTAG